MYPEGAGVLVDPGIYLDSGGDGKIEIIKCSLGNFKTGDVLMVTTVNSATAAYDSSAFTTTYNYATGVLTITDPAPTLGTGTTGRAWENLLRTLTFYPATGAASQNNVRTVGYEVMEQGAYYSHEEGTYHYYDYISSAVYSSGASNIYGLGANWNGANADAASSTHKYYGKTGYLATITSPAENAFVFSQAPGNQGWVGGSDVSNEGTFRWMTGPEAGTDVNASHYGVTYTHWNNGEPNDSGSGTHTEDYIQMLSDGSWNDLNGTTALGYFIEWGGTADVAPVVTIKIQNHNAIKHAAGF